MKSKFITKKINYDGSQLKPLYAYTDHKVIGASIISFIGPCKVHTEHMVDMEDFIAHEEIKSNLMLHFIIEIFPAQLPFAVSLQRLFASLLMDWLNENSTVLKKQKLIRNGDDLFLVLGKKQKKLSISIASSSAVSSQIHFAVNITNEGTPVPTLSLADLKVSPENCSKVIMRLFCSEYQSIVDATEKVKPL